MLKVSCSQGESNVFESLYHHNPKVRSEAVKYLVENFDKIKITSEGEDLLKDTITERLNDDNPDVVVEVLKFDSDKLISLIGHDVLIHKLSKILCRCLRTPAKWDKICSKAITILTAENVWNCKDTNRVFLALIPFMFPCQTSDVNYVRQILKSDYAKSCDFLCQYKTEFDRNNINSPENICKAVGQLLDSKDVKLPSSNSLLETVEDILKFHKNISAVHIYYNLIILAYSMKSDKSDSLLGRKIVELMMQTLNNCKYEQVKVNTMANYTLRQNKIPSELILIVLENVIKSIKFEETSINLLSLTSESSFKIKTFETLIDKYFKCQIEDRGQCNEVIKVFLNKVCSSYEEKINFLSTYCIGHTVERCEQRLDISTATQVRVMQLLNQVLLQNNMENAPLSTDVFIKVLVSLAADVPLIRKCGIELIESLTKTNIDINWKRFLVQLIERKEEILMDEEQISLAIFNVFANVGISEKFRLKHVLSEITTVNLSYLFIYSLI